jgi:hypothetical protein
MKSLSLRFLAICLLFSGHVYSQRPNIDSLKQQKGERFVANLENFSYPTVGYGTFRTLGRGQFTNADSAALPAFYSLIGLWVGAKTPDGKTLVSSGDGEYRNGSRPEFQPVEYPIREEVKQALLSASVKEKIHYSYSDVRQFEGHTPLGIQVDQRTYVFQGKPFLVVDFQLKYVGPQQILKDAYVGLFADVDVPDGASDIADNDLVKIFGDTKQTVYFTNATGASRPAIGFVMLSHFPTTITVWNAKNDPQDDAERYRRLSLGMQQLPAIPDDYRALIAVGPFDLKKGQSARFSFAIGQSANEDKFKLAFQDIQSFFTQNLAPAGGFANVQPKETPERLATEDASGRVYEFRLYGNYPNPFNPSTEIRYELSEVAPVKLVIYDVLGREVRKLVDAVQNPGEYTTTWDGKNARGEALGSGTYFLKLQAVGRTATQKLLLVR